MKPTYIQKANLPCVDIFQRWSIYVQETPVSPYPEPKELGKRNWGDQDGDDVFLGTRTFYKSFTQKWKFLYVGNLNTAHKVVREFVEYLQGAELSIFSEYSMTGVRCIYTGGQSDNFLRRQDDNWSFTLEFNVHKPLSEGLYFGDKSTKITADKDMVIYLSDGTVREVAKGDSITTNTSVLFGIKVPK